MIRAGTPSDRPELIALAENTGMFEADELLGFAEVADASLADGSALWLVDEDDAALVGAAYLAPELMGDAVWNLHFIAIDATRRGEGRGASLLSAAETAARDRGGRLMVVETSGRGAFDTARRLYRAAGFRAEATIRDFYRDGDDKVVFVKRLSAGGR